MFAACYTNVTLLACSLPLVAVGMASADRSSVLTVGIVFSRVSAISMRSSRVRRSVLARLQMFAKLASLLDSVLCQRLPLDGGDRA